jgi:hypothetical protein
MPSSWARYAGGIRAPRGQHPRQAAGDPTEPPGRRRRVAFALRLHDYRHRGLLRGRRARATDSSEVKGASAKPPARPRRPWTRPPGARARW